MPSCLRQLTNHIIGRILCLFSITVLFGIGCGGPDAVPPVAEPAVPHSARPASDSSELPKTETDPSSSRQLRREIWEVVLAEGAKVGHSHFEEFATTLAGQPVLELVSSIEITMKRFGETVTQGIVATSVETPDGQVLRFETKLSTGPSQLTVTGEYRTGRMLIETASLGKKRSSSLDWNPAWGGFFADQQSLRQQPMQPGEERKIIALVPGTAQAGEIVMKAIHKESIKVLEGQQELLRIESSVAVSGTTITSILWADETGEVLKMSSPGLNHESYRTTKDIALRAGDKPAFDLGAQTVVQVDRPIDSPHTRTTIVYHARLANGSPADRFSDCRSQHVRKIDDHTAEITVRAIRPASGESAADDDDRPTEADRQPNNLIQSDDPAIASLAEHFAEGRTDPWALAKKFEVRVRDYVHKKNFSQAISSAADVVRSQEGDCTEHAVLLAALCRAKGIPARVAIGLVYFEPVQGFAYHMWNEVWIDDGWVPIDATLGLGGIGTGHLKIADSDLNSASPVSALLPVIEVIGQLELEVVAFE